jgi:predicted metal-dependent hydrolase
VEALRREAKVLLPRVLEKAAERTGLKYNKLTIRKTHSRWGSCTREGNISLSLYLAALPEELIEFVCIHELCHTVHPNHSAEFHALVNQFVGGREKELQKWLKNYLPR